MSINKLKSQVIDVTDKTVTLKVCLDEMIPEFQKRIFDNEPFCNMQLKINQFIDIEIITKPGQRIFNFSQSQNDYSELFNNKI